SSYRAPLAEIEFVLTELAGLKEVSELPGYDEASPDVALAIVEEAAKFATNVLDPLNAVGDREGARRLDDGTVRTPAGFREAYRQYCANGWNGLTKNPEFGGQGLPQLVATAVEEMWHAANLAFDLCPLLTQGAIEALELRGSDTLKLRYLPNMVSGKWTGTMNLTEPQAGSDLASVRTRAVAQGDGTYKISGQKIFITFGEHDYTENIVHLVLARTPDAPPGVKGISLFVVPKFMVNDDGTLGERNDVHCVSLEHKLGIHASPTAVMSYGERGGATGYLVGEENRGLETMFIMMNLARFSVGLEGVGIAERAYQRAVAFARDRVQGRPIASEGATAPAAATIIEHPDIRRMLMTMRANTEAMRAMAYVTAAAMDHARRNADPAVRKQKQALVDFMIPIVKGWCTERAQEVAYMGIQVHGGMGFIEETGAAQHYRDARIITIYEGTTGIQANDFIGRKTARDGGAVARAVAADIAALGRELAAHADPALKRIGDGLVAAVTDLETGLGWMLNAYQSDARAAHAVAVPYLELWGVVIGGAQLARAATIASARLDPDTGHADFMRAKIATALFYATHLLPQTGGLARSIVDGAENALALSVEQF
ncbi:MAG: acyl-CoA dehydrogenase, partial [Pseudomonadota bacterium]|nr:acyl-CoA dehydrogenase [Pseudomonadota bacterium]